MLKSWNTVFKLANTEELLLNPFKKIGDEWFLLTAGDSSEFNTMTASWGSLGVFWNKPVITCFVRPTRHTFSLIEESDIFTLSFMGETGRSILQYCGSHSGRDVNKIKETGLVPVALKNEGISFEQAELVFECRKIYFDEIKPVFIIPDGIDETIYPNKDYHKIYIGEIVAVYEK